MKVGDLIKVSPKWAKSKQKSLGLITKIEKDFYKHNDYFQDRLSILWLHANGATTREPSAFVEIVESE